jgi:hypothetical protein
VTLGSWGGVGVTGAVRPESQATSKSSANRSETIYAQ